MSGYIGVSSKARNISDMYIGVNGVARKVKKAYIGVNGVAKKFYDADDESGGGSTTPTTYTLTYSTSNNVARVYNGSTLIASGSSVAAGTSLTASYGTTSTASLGLEDEVSSQGVYTYTLSYKKTSSSSNSWIELATSTTTTVAFEMPACDCTIRIVRTGAAICTSFSAICDTICDSCSLNVCTLTSVTS